MPATHFDIESYRVFPCIACHMITSSISFECHMIIDSSSHAALAKVKYTPHGTASVQLRSLRYAPGHATYKSETATSPTLKFSKLQKSFQYATHV